ncbi:hypothetical protein CA223_15220 [Sphingomonas koreensis]|uniref:Uncharacterized protein n=1 Tax=Sphingomonas koreensis TaxID=93064 RepID=A0A1L6J984_9SPHN|nr:hypothetical protein BRX40_06450 [Sphingomonas koreensis]RSU22928.1 hypothetical protein CA224_06035 [Sphingomonas koreensis]RSU26793.1 hypothetical protein CA225_12425 [Sphingomonas koreensis]RSU30598.1 hypothetical protein CA222_00505 [Sphingomonas koreensis]RSU36963.1 hypothetical protein CA223_15220 [Sphingomonas koreensis]
MDAAFGDAAALAGGPSLVGGCGRRFRLRPVAAGATPLRDVLHAIAPLRVRPPLEPGLLWSRLAAHPRLSGEAMGLLGGSGG